MQVRYCAGESVGDKTHDRSAVVLRSRPYVNGVVTLGESGGVGIDRGADAQIAQRRLGDPLEDRRSDDAAGPAALMRRVDDNDDREGGIPGRQEAGEGGVVLRSRIAAIDQLRRGSRLP